MSFVKLQAIVPAGKLIDTSGMASRAQQQLQRDCLTVINRAAQYPEQEDTDYVRSGDLGRGWKAEVQGPGEINVVNRTVKTESRYRTKTKGIVTRQHAPRAYAKYVQGPRDEQSGVMVEKGWESIEDIADEVFEGQSHVYTELLFGGSMTKFDLLREMLLQQLEMNREAICNPNTEQMTIVVKFRPHDGPPRSAQLSCLHVFDGPANTRPGRAAVPAGGGSAA